MVRRFSLRSRCDDVIQDATQPNVYAWRSLQFPVRRSALFWTISTVTRTQMQVCCLFITATDMLAQAVETVSVVF